VSWVYLPGQAADCSLESCLAGEPFARWKSNLSPRQRLSDGSATTLSSLSRSGMTSEPSTGNSGAGSSTSSAADSLAKISAAPALAPGSQARARAFGLKCSALLAKFGLHLSSSKIPRIFELAALSESSKDLPGWVMWDLQECWALGTSARIIGATGCGSLLPTPIASDRNGDRQRGAGSISRGGGRRLTLDMLPTPTAWLCGSDQGGAAGRTGAKRLSLEGRTGGVFIALREWMMGWPIGWSGCAPLATDRFREWLQSHGKCSLESCDK
jgi:hypothetical protein